VRGKGIEAVREFRSVMKADRAMKEVIPGLRSERTPRRNFRQKLHKMRAAQIWRWRKCARNMVASNADRDARQKWEAEIRT
jgi:hypothetical protein